jgi:hypothetical protein
MPDQQSSAFVHVSSAPQQLHTAFTSFGGAPSSAFTAVPRISGAAPSASVQQWAQGISSAITPAGVHPGHPLMPHHAFKPDFLAAMQYAMEQGHFPPSSQNILTCQPPSSQNHLQCQPPSSHPIRSLSDFSPLPTSSTFSSPEYQQQTFLPAASDCIPKGASARPTSASLLPSQLPSQLPLAQLDLAQNTCEDLVAGKKRKADAGAGDDTARDHNWTLKEEKWVS